MNAVTQTTPICETDRDAFAKLKTEAAMCGCSLLRLEDGTFLLGKWELQTELPSIEAVEQFLSRMEGV
jgi:hypothetical protein